jgi:hypothetical protein
MVATAALQRIGMAWRNNVSRHNISSAQYRSASQAAWRGGMNRR